MPRILDDAQLRLAKVRQGTVLTRALLQSLICVNQQGWCLDILPKLNYLSLRESRTEKIVGVLIVLPGKLSVFQLHHPCAVRCMACS